MIGDQIRSIHDGLKQPVVVGIGPGRRTLVTAGDRASGYLCPLCWYRRTHADAESWRAYCC